MTVSKFDPLYIAKSIILIFFPLLIVFFVFFATGYEDEFFEFTKEGVLWYFLIFVIVVAFNYLFWHKLIKIFITDEEITFKNLMTRQIIQIKFDEIEEISSQWSNAQVKYIGLNTTDDDEFRFDDRQYANFDEIKKVITENINKKSHLRSIKKPVKAESKIKTATSKFRFLYIVKSIAITFLLFVIILSVVIKIPESILFAFALLTAVSLNYLVFYKLIKVIVTENDVTFKNIITRKKIQVKFDEVQEVLYETSSWERHWRHVIEEISYKKHICLKMKNGNEWWFNDVKYRNFEELEKAIIANTNKKSA